MTKKNAGGKSAPALSDYYPVYQKIEDYQVICNQLKICVSHKAFVNLFGNISALTNRPDNK